MARDRPRSLLSFLAVSPISSKSENSPSDEQPRDQGTSVSLARTPELGDRGQVRLQVARRHIDDQPPDTAVAHCRQFRGNELVMPVRRKWGARVELAETVLCEARKIGAK